MTIATATERIEATFPRGLMHYHESMQWQLLKDDVGYFVREWFDINKLDAGERAAYDAEEAMMPPEAKEEDPEYEAYIDGQRPRFATPELARAWAGLQDTYENVFDEMQAYGAPGECASLAHKDLDRTRDELLAQALNEEACHAQR